MRDRIHHHRNGRKARLQKSHADRRGFSMILVILAIGFSLALTYGFMRTQVTSLQLTQNELRRDLALEAARTGISAGLLRMQDTAWVGISDTYSKITQQDSSNIASVAVTYSTVGAGEVVGVPDAELPLHVRITSVGTWTSPRDSTTTINRTVKAFVKLTPRLPGRDIRDGDVATATDVSTNPTNYQATLPFTLTATSTSTTSMNFDPGARFEGPIWLNKRLTLFNAESWSSTIRSTMLTEIGNQYGSTTPANFTHPHPLNGPIQFTTTPTTTLQSDLSRLKTAWATTTQIPSVAALNTNLWQTYRLYDRGPTYQAVTLSGSLTDVTLRPSATNPLGIFIRNGNLDVYDHVHVQGTLVVTGTLTFWGEGSTVTAYNWINSGGTALITDADKWPRLPAVVAQSLTFSDSARQVVEGSVIVNNTVSGGGGNFGYSSSNWVNLTGTATATRGQQPYSTIQLQGSPNLTSISGNQVYAIWLSTGAAGRWYQIESVNSQAKTLTVIGEVKSTTPLTYRIRPNRSRLASLHGPVATGTISIAAEPMWDIASIVWSNTFADWDNENDDRENDGLPNITFPDWVSTPDHLINQGWFIPWQTAIYGLPLEPTFSIQPTTGVNYLASPPLFMPYSSSGEDSAASGYRWKIIDWREDI